MEPSPQPTVPVTTGMKARVCGLTSDFGKTLNGLIVTVHLKKEQRFTVLIDKNDLSDLPAETVKRLDTLKNPGPSRSMSPAQAKEFAAIISTNRCVRIKPENLESVCSLDPLTENMESPDVIQHNCRTCGVSGVTKKLSYCSKCKVVRYCSRECQKMDYPRHKKKECKALKKERKQPNRREDLQCIKKGKDDPTKSDYVNKFNHLIQNDPEFLAEQKKWGNSAMHSIDNLIRKAMPKLEYQQRIMKKRGTPAFYIADMYEANMEILSTIAKNRHIVAITPSGPETHSTFYSIGNSIRGDQPVELIMFREGSDIIAANCMNVIGMKISLGEIKIGKDPMIIPDALATAAGYMPLKIIPCDAKLKYEAFKEVGFQHTLWVGVGLMKAEYTLVHVVCPDLNGKFPGDEGCCMKWFECIPKKYMKGRGRSSGSVKKAKKKFAKECAEMVNFFRKAEV